MELDETQVRRQWLVAFWGSIIFAVISSFVAMPVLLSMPLDPEVQQYRWILQVTFGIAFILMLYIWWAWYHYSYTLKGTNWLLMMIVAGVYSLIITPIQTWKLPDVVPEDNLLKGLQLASFLFSIFVLYANYRLYLVNKVHLAPHQAQVAAAFSGLKGQLNAKPSNERSISEKLVLNEDKVRGQYWVVFGLLTAIALVALVPMIYRIFAFGPNDFPAPTYQSFFSTSSFLLLGIWASWFFPLKERGTKWLLFLLLAIVALIVGSLVLDFSGPDVLDFAGTGPQTPPPGLLQIIVIPIVGVYMFLVTLALYLVNRSRRKVSATIKP